MINYQKQTDPEPIRYIAFHKEDLQFMACKALSYGKEEEGFSLFGLSTPTDNMVCMLPVSSGPNAIRNTVHFRDDPEFVMQASRFLLSKYNFLYIGNVHSHPMDLVHPSGNDQRQIHDISTKNSIGMLAQIIITYQYCPEYENQWQRGSKNHERIQGGLKTIIGSKIKQFCQRKQKFPFVKFNSYIYLDAQTGNYQPLKIKLLKGTNPVREQLLHTELSEFVAMNNDKEFPLERIIIDEYIQEEDVTPSYMPEILSEKLLSLPEKILAHSKMTLTESDMTISVGVLDRYVMMAQYSIDKDCPLQKVTLSHDSHISDLTQYITRSITDDNMSSIYAQILKLIQKKKHINSGKVSKKENGRSYFLGAELCD